MHSKPLPFPRQNGGRRRGEEKGIRRSGEGGGKGEGGAEGERGRRASGGRG